MRDALAEADNWEVVASADTGGVVLLAPVGPEPMLDPGGGVQVLQQVAPLEVELDRYGEAPISGPATVHVSSVRLGGANATSTTVTDWFATAVYWDLGRTERLSAPSFEHHAAGYSLTATETSFAGAARSTVIDHDTELWEDDTLDLALEPPPPGILDVVIVQRQHEPLARRRAAGIDEPVLVVRRHLRRGFVGDRPACVVDDIRDVRRDPQARVVRVRRIARRADARR